MFARKPSLFQRCRRCCVVAAILGVAVALWWSRPRMAVDHRLVGRWSMGVATSPYTILELRADGTGIQISRFHAGAFTFPWGRIGERLFFGECWPWPNNSLTKKLSLPVYQWTGVNLLSDDYEIVSIATDSVVRHQHGYSPVPLFRVGADVQLTIPASSPDKLIGDASVAETDLRRDNSRSLQAF